MDYVRASHIIEHFPDKIFTMNELWRVLKPAGRVHISVPTTEGPGALSSSARPTNGFTSPNDPVVTITMRPFMCPML